jgi:diguanylate cyclase (GGDEF)-like protein
MSEFVRRILVIDDNPAIHADFEKILAAEAEDPELGDLAAVIFGEPEEAGKPRPRRTRPSYRLVHAHQGQEGLAMAQAAFDAGEPFHVAFVDIRMPPGWDGVETIEHLWKVDPHLQSVICSAYSDYSWDQMHTRLGDSDRLLLLKKPFDTVEISQLAAALSEKYRLAQVARFRMDELDRLVAERTRELQRANEQLLLEVEQRRNIEERLRHDVLHDRLTGLPNRAMLIDRIDQCIRRKKRDARYLFALLFMDMDDFKVVNDSLGHEAGDQLLIGIGERLAGAVRSIDVSGRLCEDVSSRLGGDEFVLLLDGLATEQDAVLVAERINAIMRQPFEIKGHEISANMSIGIAMGRTEYDRAADILRDADTAVYRAKELGKHGFALFDAVMHSEVRQRLELENDLRKALGTGQFELAYQPVVSLETGDIVGFESLVRWRHPVAGTLLPDQFLPIAELSGLIVPIGMEVIRMACEQVKVWREQLGHIAVYRELWVTVNLSGKQLHMPQLAQQIDAIVAETGCPRGGLRLEITENVVMEQEDAAMQTLRSLHDRYRMALDDFGTGYSSLSHLHRMPVDTVKIDRSFIRQIDSPVRSYSATVQAIVNLAHNCNMTIVGEGVETLSQLVQLQTLDCDLAQGFWFSQPVSAKLAQEMLRDNLGSNLWRTRVLELARGLGAGGAGQMAVTASAV